MIYVLPADEEDESEQKCLHLQWSHWICIGRISQKIPQTFRKKDAQ